MKLPRDLSGYKALKTFKRDGWSFVRQKGSHMIMTKPGSEITLSIPDHNALDPGLLKDLIRDAKLTLEEFLDLL